MSFFVNSGGDDTYNHDTYRSDPYFGVVYTGYPYANLAGVFLDLGGGSDTYNTTVEGIGNDAAWYTEPIGSDVTADRHKGVGLDR